MKFINIETEESQESTQQTINYSRSDYINIDLPYDDLYLMDTVATDSFDNEPKKIELINPINVQGLDKCYQSLKYFTIDNLFSELQTSVLKELARKNLGIDLNTISVKGDIKLGIINLSQLSEVKQIQSELTETNQIAYFIITDNSGKLPSKLTAYSVPTNVVRQLLFTSPNPTALKLLNIVASKVSFSPIGVNVGDLIALTRIKVKVSDLTNVIGITIPGTSEIELYLYKILATNDAKPYNYNGITQGVMGLMSPWDKTEVNKISGIENIANAALPRIDYLPSKWENNMNNCLETGVYPWCTLGRPAGSTGAYTCISIKSSTNDGNYYTIEQTAYGRLNELGLIYKRIIFYKKDGTDTLYHDWINISDSFKTNYYTKDESVELFAKKTSVESNNEKISKILSGETPVEKADKLTTKRTISLSGYAVSNTPYFDGSSNVTISVNSINDRGLLLGQSPKEGDYYRAKMTPIDTANLEFSTNRLAFNNPECITIEYSNDGGNTWLDYEATDILKIGFISGIETPFFLGKNTTALTANQDMLRIKINHNRGAYTSMQRLYIYLSTQGAMVDNSYALLCKVEKSLCKDPENLSLVGNYLVSGWAGWNSINIDGYFGSVSDNNVHTIQLTFSFNNLSSAYISKTKAKIMKLLMLGNTVYTNSTGCKLLQTGHIYNYDLYKNVIFPAKLTSTILESNIETGTAPIKVKSTTKVSNLKSEYSEKDVNGNIIHTTYATKLEVENEINRAEKIVRKEDIVNNLTDGGADKALSAEMGRNLSFPDWLDLNNSILVDSYIPFLSNAGNINIAGFDKSVKLGFLSFIKGHSLYGNRFRLAWNVNNEWVYGEFAFNVDFRAFNYTINGKKYVVSMDVDSVPDSDTVHISQVSGTPQVQMNDKYSVSPTYNDIKSEVKIESDRALLAETVLRYRDINIEYTGTDTASVLQNALKYLRIETDNPDITSVQFRIISLVKNHETYAYRFGLGSSLSEVSLWISTSDNIFDGKVHSQQFNVTVDGSNYTYKVYFQLNSSAAISDGVIISHTYDLSPYIVMTDAIDYIGDLAAQREETENLKLAVNSIEGKVNEIEDKINEIGGTTSFDKSILLKGQCYYYKSLDEALNTTTAYSWYSNIFQVVEGQFVHIITDGNNNVIPAVILYDTEGNPITSKWSNIYGELDVIEDFKIPKGVTHMAVNCYISNIDSFELTITAKSEDAVTEDNYTMPLEQRNVVFMGSSNVWGDGFLAYSYLKAPIEWLYKSSGKFTPLEDVFTDGGVIVKNDAKFLGNAVRISGVGAKISFKHRGSELNVCQVIERSSEYAVIGLYDGGVKVAEFTNHNGTIGSGNASFTGNGSQTKFNLDRCFTYNHQLTVNGVEKNIALNTQGYGASFSDDGVDCLVIRAVDAENAKVIHSLWFKEAPENGAVINVEYDYGETISFVKSTVGETSDGVNESPYGDGTISYDPNNPATIGAGLDYRLVNEKAFFKYWFDDDAERNITLKIERGSANPYFTFNFASSVYHNVMNAGIGGYTAERFNTTTNNPLTSWVNIADYFTPDFVSIGLTGNDDWQNFPRKINRIVNMSLAELRDYPSLEIGKIEHKSADDTYDVTVNSGVITEITARSLKSPSIIGSEVAVGDFVRIGTYTGDLRQVQTRRVESVDAVNGVVTWAEPLHLNEFICLDSLQDLVGQDVSIRSIEQYMTNMRQLIENILSINPKCKVCLFNIYYVDMWVRDTAEYTYIQQWIASEFPANVFVVDAWKYSRNYVECSRKSRTINVTADGGNEIAFASPSTLGHWEGVEVWVGDRNVYGTDCYVVTGYKYTVDPNKSGTALNWEGTSAYLRPYTEQGEMQIKWKKNVPASGTAITIKLAYRQWSTDWGHPGNGDYIDNSLGRAMVYTLNK